MSVYGTVHDTNGSSTRRYCTMLRNKSRKNVCSDFFGEVVSVAQRRHTQVGHFRPKFERDDGGGGGVVNLDRKKGLPRVTEFMNGP